MEVGEQMGKMKYAMKKSFNAKDKYLIIVSIISLFLIVGSFSYALFATKVEGKGTLNIAVGKLNSVIESNELNKNHSITLNAGESKTITITLKNLNIMDAKFNLWYEKVEGVTVSYDSSKDTPPTKDGYVIAADQKKVYQLKVINSTSDTKTITFGSDAGLFDKPLSFPEGKLAVEGQSFISVLKKKINDVTKVYDDVTDDEKKEMFTFHHEAGAQQEGWSEEELTDYRYIGNDPNNYVNFNNEVWRIIGVFTVEDENGKKEKRIKIIKDQSIGKYSLDNTETYGVNDWSISPLQRVLNSGAYYNRTSENCPNGSNGSTTICDFSSNGLMDEAKKLVGKTKWYLGGHDQWNNTNASQSYSYERGLAVYSGSPMSWVGEVGIMYPSDYGYAASGSECLSTVMYQYDLSCKNTDWLFNLDYQWTLGMRSDSTYYVFAVNSSGRIYSNYSTYDPLAVRPSLYLKSGVEMVSGDGSLNNPYTLAME